MSEDRRGWPVLASWGAGVDSTAMLVECVSRGQPPDYVLFADPGMEKPATYAFIPVFRAWLQERGVPLAIVRNETKQPLNWPPYEGIEESCITNGTLPSKAFGRNSCSVKYKISPQNTWTERWQPAIDSWARGGKVRKLIGFDCSARDDARYVDQDGVEDPKYAYEYPLRALGWKREDCVARIEAEGLAVPPKSSCLCCPVTKPHEVDEMGQAELRRIVLMEARAAPRLRAIEGLWRRPVKGMRGAVPRPGSMTAYIRAKALLPAAEVDALVAMVPRELARRLPDGSPDATEDERARWAALLDAYASPALNADGMRRPYSRKR